MNRRNLIVASLQALTGAAAAFAAVPFIKSLLPSARAQALGNPIRIDLSALAPGEIKAYLYRGAMRCHQSGFDYGGRVIRGPAPRNLPVPPHRYANSTTLIIGEPTAPT